MNAWDVVEFLAIWFTTWVFLTAVLYTVYFYLQLRRARAELEKALKLIEEIERMNERREDP